MAIVPPGGFAGFSQMTAATRARFAQGVGRTRTSSGRRRRRKGSTKKVRARARSRSRKSRMKFGSPAWQKKYRVGKYNKRRRK